MKIYHNAQCSKSRKALAQLEAEHSTLQVVPYLDTPATVEEMLDLISRSDSPATDFVRWPDAEKRGLTVDDKNDPAQIAALIAQQPKIMQRPLVDTGHKVIICRSDEALKQI